MENKKGRNLGIIGCGYRMRDILKILLKINPNHKILSVYDVSKDSINKFKKDFGEVESCEDYNEITNNPNIDWIMIGSINSAHKYQIISALKGGKHIFCEKPLAVSIDECREIKNFYDDKTKFFISYPIRYADHYKKIKELIEIGEIGKIISMDFNEVLSFNHGAFIMTDWRRIYKNSGGHLLEKCCHDIALVNWITGSFPINVASFGGLNFFKSENFHLYEKIKDKIKLEFNEKITPNPFISDKDIVDNQIVIIEYKNGIRATFHTNCSSGIPERRMYICGSEGTIRADFIKGKIEIKKFYEKDIREVHTPGDDDFHGGGDMNMIEDLNKTMLDLSQPKTSMKEAILSAVSCIMMDEAMRKKQVINLEKIWKEFY